MARKDHFRSFAPAKPITRKLDAEIAQLVEHSLAKVGVASSSLVFRSCKEDKCAGGGIGRRATLRG